MIVTSKVPKGTYLDLCTELEYSNISNMCIKESWQSEYSIPENLQNIVWDMLAAAYQSHGTDKDGNDLYDEEWKYNCYLTLKHEYVNPGSLGNRPGWHIDGFKSDQINFIWFDGLPTEVALGEFTLTNDHDISMVEMNRQAKKKHKVYLESKTVYDMDKELVHRPVINLSEEAILRTFIKLTFTKETFNCIHNAWNYKLPHIKGYMSPKQSRNHGVII